MWPYVEDQNDSVACNFLTLQDKISDIKQSKEFTVNPSPYLKNHLIEEVSPQSCLGLTFSTNFSVWESVKDCDKVKMEQIQIDALRLIT